MDTDFDKIVQKILSRTGLTRDDLLDRIQKKQEELGGFITPEGAATIIGREFGITPERKTPEVRELEIKDLTAGMSNVDIVGRVVRVYEPKEFNRRDGSVGSVSSIILQDGTGEIRTVLWDKQSSLITRGDIQKGSIVQVRGAYVKRGRDGQPEMNLGTRGVIDTDPDDPRASKVPEAIETRVKIKDLKPNSGDIDTLGRVFAVSEPRTFERTDGTTGKVASIMISDETGEARVSIWDDKTDIVQKVKPGDAVKLESAYVKEGWRSKPEIHIGWRGRVIINPNDPEVENLPKFERRLLKVEEVETDMPILDIAARVHQKFEPNEFTRDNGTNGRVMNVIIADETGTIRVSFWDDAVDTAQNLKEGDIILLTGARSRSGLGGQPEISVGQNTKIEVNPEGVNVDEFKASQINLGSLEPGISSLDAVGRVTEVSEARQFTRPDGSSGQVASLRIADKTGSARVSVWGDKTALIASVKVGEIIKLKNCYSTAGLFGDAEIHVGRHGDLEVNPDVDVELPPADVAKTITGKIERSEIGSIEREGEKVEVRGTIVRVFHRRPIFDACPECGRSIESGETGSKCEHCGKNVEPDHRLVLSFMVDDGTGEIRAVLFGKVGEELIGMDSNKVFDMFKNNQNLDELYGAFNLVGREVVLRGTVRRDRMFDQLEIMVNSLSIPDPKEVARELLDKVRA